MTVFLKTWGDNRRQKLVHGCVKKTPFRTGDVGAGAVLLYMDMVAILA